MKETLIQQYIDSMLSGTLDNKLGARLAKGAGGGIDQIADPHGHPQVHGRVPTSLVCSRTFPRQSCGK